MKKKIIAIILGILVNSINKNTQKSINWNLNIVNYNEINTIINKEKMDIWVCSFGGCGSNMVANYLENIGYNVKTKYWDKILCHCPIPVKCNIPIIYIFNDPKHSLLSMIRRKEYCYYENHRKLSNTIKMNEFNDEKLLCLMFKQFYNWTKKNNFQNKLLLLDFRKFFTDETKRILGEFLDEELENYPKRREMKKYNYDNYDSLFTKYKKDIDYINNFKY